MPAVPRPRSAMVICGLSGSLLLMVSVAGFTPTLAAILPPPKRRHSFSSRELNHAAHLAHAAYSGASNAKSSSARTLLGDRSERLARDTTGWPARASPPAAPAPPPCPRLLSFAARSPEKTGDRLADLLANEIADHRDETLLARHAATSL